MDDIQAGIHAIARTVPDNKVYTETILDRLQDKLNEHDINILRNLSVNTRYVSLRDYAAYVAGEAPREIETSANDMMLDAIQKCLHNKPIEPSQIDLFIAATDTPVRPMPCTAYEVIEQAGNLLSHDMNVLNLQNEGCSVLPKALEIAKDHLQRKPDKYVLITLAECHTGLGDSLHEEDLAAFREAERNNVNRLKLPEFQNLLAACLFGDGAAALLVGRAERGMSTADHFEHLTNIHSGDKELLHMDEGGTFMPSYEGFPHYIMGKKVPSRGGQYAHSLLNQFFERFGTDMTEANDFDYVLIHTGSKKIIDKLCEGFDIDPSSEKVRLSYEVLRDYANLSSCSVAFMLEELVNRLPNWQNALVISFGVGFSGSINRIYKYQH